MLNWTVTHCDSATAGDGTIYTIRLMTFGPKNQYLAVRSYIEDNGRLWENTIGLFATREAAKTACENDAKS